MTHYERLGISPPSEPKEIKMAYFKKAKECHPDIHGSSKTQEFQALSAAYSVLSNPTKKSAYDISGYQDRNYDQPATGGTQGPGYQDFPDINQAYETFRQVFMDFGLQEYYSRLVEDVSDTYEVSVKSQDYRPFWELAKRRKGLIFGLIFPTMALARFPLLGIALLRGFGSLFFFGFQILGRNPQLQRVIFAWLWRQMVLFYKRMAEEQDRRGRGPPTGGTGTPPSGGTNSGGTSPKPASSGRDTSPGQERRGAGARQNR